jgi:hypothetical protein
MSRLDWKEGGRFDRVRETQQINAALRGFQNAEIEDEIGYYRFWPEESEMHAVYDEPNGAGLVFHPMVDVPVLHATRGEGRNDDTPTGFYYVDDLYVTASFSQLTRTGLTFYDVEHQTYLRDRISYDSRLFRVNNIHVTGQISQTDFMVGIEAVQLKPDELLLAPQFHDDFAPDTGVNLQHAGAGLWTGHGPPPDVIPGMEVGDEYLDLDSGQVYRLDVGP